MEIFRTECTKQFEKRKRLYVEFDEIIRENVLQNQKELYGRRLADMKLHEIVRDIMISFLQDPDDFTGGQEPSQINSEPTNNIEAQIDNKKSDEH